ncbi:2-oxoacid:acceptor oxidoreductase subunit alpha [bacterium]|nr:2-oxoacid:acceptor oxidoreductase subunit alpha [bacterium]
MPTDLSIGIAGSGGDGVILLGELLARFSARAGLNTILLKSYGPQIRGGESSARIRVSSSPLSWAGDSVDALLLFHSEALRRFSAELSLKPGAQILLDSLDDTALEHSAIPASHYDRVLRVPFDDLAMESAKTKLAKNMVMAGVACELYRWPDEGLGEYIQQRFARQGERAVNANLAAVEAGRSFARANLPVGELRIGQLRAAPLHFISGDEAFAYGALCAGCRFMAGYPISPASEILEWMSRELPKAGGVCVQAEDEIAGLCMAIGAGYGGIKALTATSGPGLSLKQEGLGLASMAEIPVVLCNVQRCGPSTGIPTRTEQADLNAAIYGGHGDSPRVVLAATSVGDCYELAQLSFELAERFQTPVIVLLDQYLGQSVHTVPDLQVRVRDPRADLQPLLGGTAGSIDAEPWRRWPTAQDLQEQFQRYSMAGEAVAATSVPGLPGGEYIAVGIEHNALGEPVSSQDTHERQTARRYAKLEQIAREHPGLAVHGAPQPKIALLTWGSTYGVCCEAADILSASGTAAQVLAPRLLSPLPKAELQQWLDGLADSGARLVVVETSFSGQFLRHLRGELDLPRGYAHLHRSGGYALRLSEVLDFIKDDSI